MIAYRHYGDLGNHSGIVDIRKEGEFRTDSQIFGFVVAGTSRLSVDTLNEAFLERSIQAGDSLSPNMVTILEGGLLIWGNFKDRRFEKHWNDESATYGMTEKRDNQIR